MAVTVKSSIGNILMTAVGAYRGRGWAKIYIEIKVVDRVVRRGGERNGKYGFMIFNNNQY